MDKKDIATVLKVKRNEAGYAVKEVVEMLAKRGIQVADKTVYGWESGHRQPDSDVLLELCNIYGIKSFDEFTDNNSSLSIEEKRIIDDYRKLSFSGRNLINETIKSLIDYERVINEAVQAQDEQAATTVTREMIPVYHSKAAAGSPLPILTDTWDNVRKDVSTPKAANFGIVLAGDSMEPDYPDGCMVWVEAQETLESGDIGIFALFGEAVCKKFYLKDGKCRLLSLNPKYAPIEITEDTEMKIYGKVISLAEGR